MGTGVNVEKVNKLRQELMDYIEKMNGIFKVTIPKRNKIMRENYFFLTVADFHIICCRFYNIIFF